MPCKFGRLAEGGAEHPHTYPNIWCAEHTTGPDRLVLAPASDHIGLMLDLMGEMAEPFGILYVLLVSRRGRDSGRYQSPQPLDRQSTIAFLRDFADYFQGDGRHHVWIMSLADDALLVYDHHNVLYAYGPLDRFIAIARRRGLTEAPVKFPAPHSHFYNLEFDRDEDRLFEQHEWLHFPLQPDDDL